MISFEQFQQWFYGSVLLLLGLSFLRNPARWRATCPYFCNMQTEEWAHDRIMDASMRRKIIENISPNLGYYLGTISLALGIWCAVTPVFPALPFALFCLALCGTLGIAYLQMRNSQRCRVAVLDVRRPSQTIAPLWFIVGALLSFAPLVDVGEPSRRVTLSVITAAALGLSFLAWRLTMMPALLEGVDLSAERFVDDTLRTIRATQVLTLALVLPFVYLAQTSILPGTSPLHMYLESISFIPWFLQVVMSLRRSKRGPDTDDLRAWEQ